MNTPTVAEDSKRDLAAFMGTPEQLTEKLTEAWFAEPSSRRPSSIPPSFQQRIGEFLGDPEVDAWLR